MASMANSAEQRGKPPVDQAIKDDPNASEIAAYLQRRSAVYSGIAILGAIAMIYAVVNVFAVLRSPFSESSDYVQVISSTLVAFGIVTVLYIGARIYLVHTQQAERERVETEYQARQDADDNRNRLQELQQQIVGEPVDANNQVGNETDLNRLWVANQILMQVYHDVAVDQAQRSFKNAQRAAYAGFFALVLIAGFSAFTPNPSGAVTASIIGVAGAGLSAYIGATFMKSKSEATAQLREFFGQPVEASRVLSAERLLQAIEAGPERTRIVQDVAIAAMKRDQTTASQDAKNSPK